MVSLLVDFIKYFYGLVYAEIEIINGDDLAHVRKNIIDKDEVKRMWVTALVDTGS